LGTDLAAAMLGGISGHSCLFSNALEFGILFSVLAKNGYYRGKQYLKKETIDLFTTRTLGKSTKGLGFDLI